MNTALCYSYSHVLIIILLSKSHVSAMGLYSQCYSTLFRGIHACLPLLAANLIVCAYVCVVFIAMHATHVDV